MIWRVASFALPSTRTTDPAPFGAAVNAKLGCFIVNSAQSVPCISPDAQAQATSWTDQVGSALPGSAAVPPSVAYDAASGQLTVTLRWQMRGDTTVHNFIAATQVSATL